MESPGSMPILSSSGNCSEGIRQYAIGAFHFSRTLALAAKLEGALAVADAPEATSVFRHGLAVSLEHLQVIHLVVALPYEAMY